MTDPGQPRVAHPEAVEDESSGFAVIRNWLRWRRRHRKPETALRDAIEELIEEAENDTEAEPARSDEGSLLLNILKLRDLAAEDIMVPRADVIAAPLDVPLDELVRLLIRRAIRACRSSAKRSTTWSAWCTSRTCSPASPASGGSI